MYHLCIVLKIGFCYCLQERDRIIKENNLLRTKVDSQNDQIATLKTHIGVIRQHTITFILDQMDTLHMQRDTEV